MNATRATPDLYVLAGGESSRFGSDKARAMVDGLPLILHIVRNLGGCVRGATAVAARPDQYRDLGLRTIGDRAPGLGPLAGLQAALHDGPMDRWVLLVSCDFVAAEARRVRLLLEHVTPQARAVAYRHIHWEPLFALYHGSLRAEVDRRLESGQRAMQQLLDELSAVAVPLPDDWPAITAVNTPGELADFLSRRSGSCDTLKQDPQEDRMRYTVLLFGPAAHAMGQRAIEVDLQGPRPTVAHLRTALAAAHPALTRFLPPSRLAINHQFAAEDCVLSPNDEIALVGMVSGG